MPSPFKRKTKVAVIIPKYGLAGGAERFAAILTEHIALNHAYDVHVFANKWISNSETITFHHVPIIYFPRFMVTLSFAWFVHQSLQAEQFDIIHTHDRIFHADIFTMHGVPHFFWVQEIRGKRMSLFDRVTCWVENKILSDQSCQFFLPVSGLARNQYLRKFPDTQSKMKVMAPGIDLERFTPEAQVSNRQNIRIQFNLAPSDFVILFVGMNFELKGLNTLISSLALARKTLPERSIKLLVVGKGDQVHFIQKASALGVQDSVIFAGVQNQGVENFYAAADIVALLSGFDTFGMTVLEAMASGVPVIITPNVGAKDLVLDGVHGYIVNNNSSDVSERIILLAQDNQLRLSMGQAARSVAENHSWNKVALEISGLYDLISATK